MSNLRYEMKQTCLERAYNDGSGKQIQDRDTAKTYRNAIDRFCKWAKETEHINNIKQIERAGGRQEVIQRYEKYLEGEGKSASTIHTYLSPVCKGLGVHLSEIEKPKRRATDITRSRKQEANRQGKAEAEDNHNQRLYQFQRLVGIRRNELARLTVMDFKKDESGYLCVRVAKGKGGKEQLQRVLPADVPKMSEFIRATIRAVASSDKPREQIRLFTREEMNNKIDLHGIRAEHSREAYQYYLERCSTAEGRAKLQKELVSRWNTYHGEKGTIIMKDGSFNSTSVTARRFIDEFSHKGKYELRGANKTRCLEAGRPIAYDRTALLCVSVFHLSHWRNDVTVKHYML